MWKLHSLKEQVIQVSCCNFVKHYIDNNLLQGVIGAIDGCTVNFKAPKYQHDSYIDRHKRYSIKLQGIVTCNKIFTNVFIGFPGSAHDGRVKSFKFNVSQWNNTILQFFRNSGLFAKVSEQNQQHRFFYNGKHLIGDSAYPLLDWLITPYQ